MKNIKRIYKCTIQRDAKVIIDYELVEANRIITITVHQQDVRFINHDDELRYSADGMIDIRSINSVEIRDRGTIFLWGDKSSPEERNTSEYCFGVSDSPFDDIIKSIENWADNCPAFDEKKPTVKIGESEYDKAEFEKATKHLRPIN